MPVSVSDVLGDLPGETRVNPAHSPIRTIGVKGIYPTHPIIQAPSLQGTHCPHSSQYIGLNRNSVLVCSFCAQVFVRKIVRI